MKSSERDRLLQEILAGDDLTEFRQASLDHGLTLVRRLRHRLRASATDDRTQYAAR